LSAEANPRTSSHNEETVMQVMRTIAQDCCVTIGVNSQQSQNSSKLELELQPKKNLSLSFTPHDWELDTKTFCLFTGNKSMKIKTWN
jgi:hypothetical protein